MKCSSSLDTKEAFSILTFIVPVYIYTQSPTLRTNNAENTEQCKQQAVDGNTTASQCRLVIFNLLTLVGWSQTLLLMAHTPADPTNYGGESRSDSLLIHMLSS